MHVPQLRYDGDANNTNIECLWGRMCRCQDLLSLCPSLDLAQIRGSRRTHSDMLLLYDDDGDD
jgi:hypothetical protein